jgi:hypothetical protein
MLGNPEYARLQIDYPEELDRLTTFFRIIWIIPTAIITGLVSHSGQTVTNTIILNQAGSRPESAPTCSRLPTDIRRLSTSRLSTWKSTTPT